MAELSQFEKDGVVYDLKDTNARNSVSEILRTEFRLIAELDIPETEDSFNIEITETDDGEPLHEEEVVIEVETNAMPFSFFSCDVISTDGKKLRLAEVRGAGCPKLVHIKKIGLRYVCQSYVFGGAYSSANVGLFGTFHYMPVAETCHAISSLTFGPFRQITAKVYAKHKVEE